MSFGSADGDRPAEVAFAELANRSVDLPHRPPDEQQEQSDEDERAGNQRRREPRQLLLCRARVLLQRFEPARSYRSRMPFVTTRVASVSIAKRSMTDAWAGAGAQHSVHFLRERGEAS